MVVILDNTFRNKNNGETPPTRRIKSDANRFTRSTGDSHRVEGAPACGLKITNLDRDDPPGYTAGDYPRGTFNKNVGDTLLIGSTARMPTIEVVCKVDNFDPAETPIQWRLSCLQVLGRHSNTGNSRYASAVEVLKDEWQGTATKKRFTLFEREDSGTVEYTYNTNSDAGRVMGGHALLMVSAKPPGLRLPLIDYVHLRIGGTNPTEAEVLAYLRTQLAGRDNNIFLMIEAAFAHESNYIQFRRLTASDDGKQTRIRYKGVLFDWPDDPIDFPMATFDFGIGISQYTRVANQAVSPWVVWDWRDNVNAGVNIFFDKLRGQLRGRTWRQAAWRSWRRYNGSGDDAEAYANNLLGSTIGRQISHDRVPSSLNIARQTAQLVRRAAATPPTWPEVTTPQIGPQ